MGRLDVDAMLDAMKPGQLDEWAAAYELDPWDTHEDAAMLASIITNMGWRIIGAIKGVDVANQLTTRQDFLEPRRRSRPTGMLSPAESEAQAAMKYGNRR